MSRLAAFLALVAAPVAAQDYPDSAGGDTFDLERTGPDRAVLTYHNSAAHNSWVLAETLTADGLTVEVSLELSSGPETILTRAPDGWVAIPFIADVADGDTLEIQIVRIAPGM